MARSGLNHGASRHSPTGGEGRAWGGAVLALLALAACSTGPAKQEEAAGLGRRVANGDARAFVPSADGLWLSWLDGCHVARGQYLPPGTSNCELHVAPAAGGDVRRVAGAVTTLPQGLAWSRAGAALAALAGYDYGAGTGTLVLWRDGEARELARDVSFHGFGAHGELGFVSGGRLSILLPGEEAPRAVEGAEEVASFEFSPAEFPAGAAPGHPALRLAARQSRAAGGRLLVADAALKRARPLGDRRVADYGFSATGAWLAYSVEGKGGAEIHRVSLERGLVDTRVGAGSGAFSFAPDGATLAFVSAAPPGKQGNLQLAEPGRPATVAGREVGEFRWARGARRIAWLDRYDPRVRSGAIGAAGPGLEPRVTGRNITDFDLSPDGRFVAYLQHTTRGGYSVDLSVLPLDGAAQPAAVAQGVFGFAFSPDGRWLYYRTRCTRNGEGCDLERVPAAGLAKDGKPEPIAQGMKSFEFDPRDASRLLIGWQRADRPALDVGVWQAGKLVRVDQVVLPGSARFLGPDSSRLGYAVIDPKRAGVYVAELPR